MVHRFGQEANFAVTHQCVCSTWVNTRMHIQIGTNVIGRTGTSHTVAVQWPIDVVPGIVDVVGVNVGMVHQECSMVLVSRPDGDVVTAGPSEDADTGRDGTHGLAHQHGVTGSVAEVFELTVTVKAKRATVWDTCLAVWQIRSRSFKDSPVTVTAPPVSMASCGKAVVGDCVVSGSPMLQVTVTDQLVGAIV